MDLTSRLAARLAWTLQGVAPPAHLQSAQEMVLEAVKSAKKHLKDTEESHAPESMAQLAEQHLLVTSCLALEATSGIHYGAINGKDAASLSNALLNEAYAQDYVYNEEEENEEHDKPSFYKASLDLYAASVLHSSERANDKATDNDRRRTATLIASKMQYEFGVLPRLAPSALKVISAMCDIDDISKKGQGSLSESI